MAEVRFVVEKVKDENGQECDTLVRYAGTEREEWGTMNEFDQLFQAASDRWGDGNWDLNKVLTAVREAGFD